MGTRKVSMALDKTLLSDACKMAGARNLSTYVNRALRLQLEHDRRLDRASVQDKAKGEPS
jgi:hypothetical protein